MPSTTMGVKLDAETRERLVRLGKQRSRSPHWLMKAAIRDYLDREERREREYQEDVARWERYVETGAHLSHEDMTRWMDGLVAQAERKVWSQR